jgi:membrane associated rhomboid family serine protease
MFLPIGHDQTVRRFPWVTLSIMAICTLLQLASSLLRPGIEELGDATRRVREIEKRIILSEYAKVGSVRMPAHVGEDYDDEPLPSGAPSAPNAPAEPGATGAPSSQEQPAPLPDDPNEFLKQDPEKLGAPDDALHAELHEAKRALEALVHRDLVERLGYRPADGFSITLLTSMFMHGGWLHLIGNMLFLWLCGMNIEDRWGHAVFGAFYVLAGLAATTAYALVHHGSSIPCVGASGAIAGAMGAFLVGYHQARLKILYWVWWRFSFKPGVFFVRAIFALPIWFLGQLFDAMIEASSKGAGGGVGYSAHVGGFVFGLGCALTMRYGGFEEKLRLPEVEDTLSEGEEEERALAAARETAKQDPSAAIADLRAMLMRHPDRIRARRLLLEMALARGDASAVATSASAVLAHLGENAEWEELARTFRAVLAVQEPGAHGMERKGAASLTDRAIALAARAGVVLDDQELALSAARRLVDAYPTSPLLRGTLWDLGPLQSTHGLAVLSPDTLRRVSTVPAARA